MPDGIVRLIAATAVVLIVFVSPTRADDESTLALGYCAEMENNINALVDYTTTKCLPVKGSAAPSFVFISSAPVFSVEASKKGWLVVVVAAFGNTFNAVSTKTDELIVSDATLMGARQAYRIPSAVARKLQRQVKAGEIDPEAMYQGILVAMEPYRIP